MASRELNKKELFEILEHGSCTEITRIKHHRHNQERVTVVYDPSGVGEQWYKVEYTQHADEGIMGPDEGEYIIEIKVKQVQKTITVYEEED